MEFLDRPVNVGQLSRQIETIGLPGFTTVHRLSRRLEPQSYSWDEEKQDMVANPRVKWLPASPPYLMVVFDEAQATPAQLADLERIVSEHIPVADPKIVEQERLQQRITELKSKTVLTDSERDAAIRILLKGVE